MSQNPAWRTIKTLLGGKTTGKQFIQIHIPTKIRCPPPPPVSLCCCQLNSKYRMKAILFFSNKFHFPRKRPGALPLVFTNFKLEHPTQSQYKVLSILKHHPDLLLMTLQIRGNTANIPALLRQYLLDSLIAIFCQLA